MSSAASRAVPDPRGSPTPAGDAPPVAPRGRVIDSATLLGGGAQLAIRHRETVYFLRETRFGKLILTK
ncbi:MAG TPA: hemin uptake protein HemP [Casimicrobiaceae bacterium]|nr:hemin uptake protein HemP [Casimicrobiaceae bacterium]